MPAVSHFHCDYWIIAFALIFIGLMAEPQHIRLLLPILKQNQLLSK
jgi:hypothetical protein